MKTGEPTKKTVEVSTQELAYVLVDLGDAIASMNKKVYSVTGDRIRSAGRRVRLMLGVQGKEET